MLCQHRPIKGVKPFDSNYSSGSCSYTECVGLHGCNLLMIMYEGGYDVKSVRDVDLYYYHYYYECCILLALMNGCHMINDSTISRSQLATAAFVDKWGRICSTISIII